MYGVYRAIENTYFEKQKKHISTKDRWIGFINVLYYSKTIYICTKKIQNIVHKLSKSLNQQGRVCLGFGLVACLSYHSSVAISYQNQQN